MKNKGNITYIYRVVFVAPPIEGDDRITFYFSSLAAIYELFTRQQMGVALKTLWSHKLSDSGVYCGDRVTITREPLMRKLKRNAGSASRASRPSDSSSEV